MCVRDREGEREQERAVYVAYVGHRDEKNRPEISSHFITIIRVLISKQSKGKLCLRA